MPGEGTAATRGEEPWLSPARELRATRGKEPRLCMVIGATGDYAWGGGLRATRGEEPRISMVKSRNYAWGRGRQLRVAMSRGYVW